MKQRLLRFGTRSSAAERSASSCARSLFASREWTCANGSPWPHSLRVLSSSQSDLDLSSGVEYLTGSAEKIQGKAVLGRYRASAYTRLRSFERRRHHEPWLSTVRPRLLDPMHSWPRAGLPAGAGTDELQHPTDLRLYRSPFSTKRRTRPPFRQPTNPPRSTPSRR